MKDGGVFVDAAECFGAGAVGEDGDKIGGMVVGGESAVDGIHFGAVLDGVAAGFVVGGDDDECFAVFLGEVQHFADGVVELDHFGDDVVGFIGVAAPVDLGTFDHQEEALVFAVALLQEGGGHFGGGYEVVAALAEGERLPVCGQVEVVFLGVGTDVFHFDVDETFYHVIVRAQFGAQVSGVHFAAVEEFGAAANEEIDVGFCEISGNFLVVFSAPVVGHETGGRCVHDGAVGDETGRQAGGFGQLQDGDYGRGVHVYADGAVVGFNAGAERGGAGGRVGYQVIAAVRFMQTYDGETLQVQLIAVAVHSGGNLGDAHAVANHQDDVLRALFGRFRPGVFSGRGRGCRGRYRAGRCHRRVRRSRRAGGKEEAKEEETGECFSLHGGKDKAWQK